MRYIFCIVYKPLHLLHRYLLWTRGCYVTEVIRTHNSRLGKYVLHFKNLFQLLRCVKFMVGLHLSTSRKMLILLVFRASTEFLAD
jgi:hypothetical protein